MAKKGQRQRFLLTCPTCNRRNYVTSKNFTTAAVMAKGKGAGSDKLLLNKYCPQCRQATAHKETKLPPSKKV